jgi:diguanylate cyclase (GGDEF)-like protein
MAHELVRAGGGDNPTPGDALAPPAPRGSAVAMPPLADASLEQRLHELEVLYDGLRALTSTLELPALVRTVLDRMKRVAVAEGLSLLLHDPDRGELVFAASETLCADTIARGATVTPRTVGLRPDALVVALKRDERPLGLLQVRERLDGRPFDEADRTRLEALAATLAPAIDSAAIAHDADALDVLFGRVAAAVPSHTTVLSLRDTGGHDLTFTSSRVLRSGVVDGLRLRLDQGVAGWVATHRTAVRLDDASNDPRHDPTLARRTGLVPKTMLCVPLVYRDALLGTVQLINKIDGTTFTQDELRLVQGLADQAAIAIANAQLYRRVEQASLTDDLTGLSNTRHFNALLPATLAEARTVSLLMLDLDALKAVVDRYGHLVGSRTIATVGRLIAGCLRPGDVAARFGGDEFVVVMPGTATADAWAVAEAIRCAIAACATPDGLPDVDIAAVTASIGVATYPEHAIGPEGLLRAADAALYAVKFAGKNGVAVAPATPSAA